MDGISATSSASLMQAVLAQAETQNRVDMAMLQKSQEIAVQQGSAAVALIEAAGEAMIDVRA